MNGSSFFHTCVQRLVGVWPSSDGDTSEGMPSQEKDDLWESVSGI